MSALLNRKLSNTFSNIKILSRDTKIPSRDSKIPSRDIKIPSRDTKIPSRDTLTETLSLYKHMLSLGPGKGFKFCMPVDNI